MNKLLLEQAIIEYRIKHILDTPHLKAKYLAEYKRETGSKVLDEGFRDWLKSTFGKAKDAGNSAVDTVKNKSKEAATKVSNVAKGLVDMGFGLKGATILAGAETFDIEKRKQMIGQAEQALNNEISQLQKIYYKYVEDTNVNGGKDLQELNKYLIEKGFPNSKTFEQDVKQIKSVYLQFIQRYEEKKVKAKLTNLTIAVLRHLVIFYQDYKVYDKNLYMNEQQRKELKALIREQTDVIKNSGEDEDYSKIKGRKQGDVSASYESAYSAKLPTALLIGGATLAALGIGANSDTFQNILERLKDMGDATDGVPEIISKVLIGKGQGITQVLQNMSGVDLGPNAKLSTLSNAAIKPLIPAIRAAVVAKNGEAGGKAFDQIINLAGSANGNNQTLGQVLQGQYAGTGKKFSDLLDVDAGSFSKVVQQKVDAVAAQPLDTVKNTLLKWMGNYAGPIMQGLGLALAAGGVASAALRTKGKLSSRMSTLKNLVDTFVDVGEKEEEGEGGGQPPVPPPEPGPTPPPEPGPTPGPTSEQPVFYVRKSGGNSLRKTSLNTWLSRKLSAPMARLRLAPSMAKGLTKGIVKLAYDSLKGQGATIQEARYVFDQEKSKPFLGGGVEKTSKKDNVEKVREPADNTDVDASKAHKFSVPLTQIQQFVKDYYNKNVPKAKKEKYSKLVDQEVNDLSGEIYSLVQAWVEYQTGTSREQLKGKKGSEEIIKKGKQTLGINEGQIVRWKQLAGIMKG